MLVVMDVLNLLGSNVRSGQSLYSNAVGHRETACMGFPGPYFIVAPGLIWSNTNSFSVACLEGTY